MELQLPWAIMEGGGGEKKEGGLGGRREKEGVTERKGCSSYLEGGLEPLNSFQMLAE